MGESVMSGPWEKYQSAPSLNGLRQKGNIDLGARPVVKNKDGSVSTVRSISVNFGDGEVLIPTVSDDGRVVSDDEAIELYKRTGRHLGIFDTPENATAYAERLHKDQAAQYVGSSKPWEKYGAAPKKAETSLTDDIKQGAGNLAAGLVRGAGSIGATILAPYDMAKDALAGKGLSLESNRQRRADMDAGLALMGAETDSFMYGAGKLGGEIAGTAGVGGLLANGARAVGAAPAIVNSLATGGFRAGQTTGLANAGVRALGGVLTGAGSAALVDPEHTGAGAVIGGALPWLAKVGGMIGKGIAKAGEKSANKLMQSAIKPTIAELRTGEADAAIRTLLDYGISPTSAGVNKIRGLVDDLNTQIADKIGSSGASISKASVLSRLSDVEGMFSRQVAPTADLSAIRGVADDFMAHPVYTGEAMPVQAAQELKQGTYRALAKKYGQLGSAETEAAKGLARGLKEEIAEAVPGVQALNAEESRLLGALSVAERRALMDLNKNPMGLAALATNPLSWAAFMADRSVAFKAMAARMLNRTANAAPDAGNMLLRNAENPLLRSSAIAISGGE